MSDAGAKPGQGAPADTPAAPKDAASAQPVDAQHPAQDTPIISDSEFEAAIPPISDDLNAPLEPIKGFAPAAVQPAQGVGTSSQVEAISDAPVPDAAEMEKPLVPLASFDVDPPAKIEGVDDAKAVAIRYTTEVEGLDEVGLESRFRDLSALKDGDGKAANAAMITARAREDEALAVRLMHSIGYYDGTATSTIVQNPENSGKVKATVTALPGHLYRLGSITIDAPATVPAGLIDKELPLAIGDPIEAERIQGAEANVSVKLPQQGYPFVTLGDRDILLDDANFTGAYTLSVDPGPRSSFGTYSTEGDLAFGPDHVGVLARFRPGELYDSRKVDDLREALVATGLFSTVSVEPQQTGEMAPDGTEKVNLLVRQDAGPPRTLAGEAGYSTGQGFRLQASWTHRNLFRPEGALIVAGIAGTQEQALSTTFRRSNAGRRDRSFSIIASADRGNFDAYEGYTGTLAVKWAYESTPIWQKRFTYSYGAQLVGTNEDVFDFATQTRDRKTYFIGAIPTQFQFDTSDDLLNPTRGYRLKANISPETSVMGGVRPYARIMLEGTAYYPISDSLVIAGRARAGTIQGVARDDLAPSRRYYSGGGGSVRGYGYQGLGPKAPDGKAIGGRSLNEFALEARYRFGNFGIVPFVDAGQVYDSSFPKASNLRFGAGIGARYYTNFGPLRVDIATPLSKQPGAPTIALYISIGQAF